MAKHTVRTPLMKQYFSIKTKHPDAILLFRVGDFYETFEEDAVKASETLGITLTKRANGAASYVDLAGFPYHALDTYMPKLVRAGQRVAICEQLEDPKKTKTIVKRGVTELITPGVTTNDNVLEHRENNFLACVNFGIKSIGVAFLDISTGEFYTTEGNNEYIDKLLNSFQPKEILYERSKRKKFTETFGANFYIYPGEDWMFNEETCRDRLHKQFDTQSLKGFGIDKINNAVVSAGAIMHYMDITHHHNIKHITTISRIEEDKYVWLDKFTIRNLEIFNSFTEDGTSLLKIIDKTISPMGSRKLRRWLALPLKDIKPINDRLDATELLISKQSLKDELITEIKKIGDLERLVSKISTRRIMPREIIQLKNALGAIVPIKQKLSAQNISSKSIFQKISEQLNPCVNLKNRISKELLPEPQNQVGSGKVIATGVSDELDELRAISKTGKQFLADLLQKLIKTTRISSLKINYNKVFGYYLDVTNKYKNYVPKEWIRKQTLVNSERYINQELKVYEEKILGAEEKINAIENKIYEDLVISLADYMAAIQLDANLIAELDCIISFAKIAQENSYIKPEINDTNIIDIKQGRHPVIEQQMSIGEEYIPNNIFLDDKEQQIIMITGPNMSGKSALLRQTALIVLMSQIGSFVPADKAKIGYVDKIFTRVGASDNISLGESTFMVEMNEASSILNNISNRSLILFDELGRGTSTYDGISIAWAIVEYIHELANQKPKTLFATHYHELNEMEKSFNRIKNYNVSIKELQTKIIFLRKLVRGGSEHSFGIHVAKMAGMPKSIVNRANKILAELEKNTDNKDIAKPINKIAKNREGYQLSIFQVDDPVLKQIRDQINDLDINNLTPIEALNTLNEIKKIL